MYDAVKKITVIMAVAEFLRQLLLADQTKRNYAASLKALTDYVGPYLTVDKLTPQHLDGVFEAKADDWRVTGSKNAVLSHMNQFCEFCRARGYAPQNWNPLAGRKRAPEEEPNRLWIDDQEFERGLILAGDERDRALWAWGRFMYSRRGEAKTVTLRDVNFRESTVRVRIHKKKITSVLELGPMSPHLDRWISFYEANLAARGETLGPAHYLFPSRVPMTLPTLHRDASVYEAQMPVDGQPGKFRMVPMRLRPAKPTGQPDAVCRDILIRLGYPEELRLGMHVLRRSGSLMDLEDMEEEGEANPMPIIRERLHHESDAMSAWYTGRSHDKKRSAAYYKRKGEQARTRASVASENVIDLASRRKAAG